MEVKSKQFSKFSSLNSSSTKSNRSQDKNLIELPKLTNEIKKDQTTSFSVKNQQNVSTNLKTFDSVKSSLMNKTHRNQQDVETIIKTSPFSDKLNESDFNSEHLEIIKKRINALKVMQIKTAILESKFYEELYLLECKYNSKLEPIKKLRRKIVSGECEPSEDQCKISFMDKSGDRKLSELENARETNRDMVAMNILKYSKQPGQIVRGIPEFWLKAFKNVELIDQMISSDDEPILKNLVDVECELKDIKPYNFKLNFHFSPNEYFHNSVLSKTYEFKVEVDPNDPYVFEAPETECSKGCEIRWKSKDKDVTKKRISNNEEYADQVSFFNFFAATDFANKERNNFTQQDEVNLAIDYEIGYVFKEKLIPRAILYYMGEISDSNEPSDTDEDLEDDEGDDDFGQPQCDIKEKCSNKNY